MSRGGKEMWIEWCRVLWKDVRVSDKRSGWDKKSEFLKGETQSNDFIREYQVIIATNNVIAREFIKLLHEYRSKKVNPSNLKLDQLYDPQKLYNYLRTHHWKKGIPEDFLVCWFKILNSSFKLKNEELSDFESILNKLNVTENVTSKIRGISQLPKEKNNILKTLEKKNEIEKQPSVRNFSEFKKWILNRLDNIEKILKN